MRYAIVQGYDLEKLVENVNKWLTEQEAGERGYTGEPHGPPFMIPSNGDGYWYQIMWRAR